MYSVVIIRKKNNDHNAFVREYDRLKLSRLINLCVCLARTKLHLIICTCSKWWNNLTNYMHNSLDDHVLPVQCYRKLTARFTKLVEY